MKLRIAHRFPCSARDFWNATRGPDYEAALTAGSEVDLEALGVEERAGHRVERVRVKPRRELPAVAAKAVGSARLSWVQETEFDDAALGTRWRVTPDVLPGKVRCEGTSRIVDVPGGCERIIEGEIAVAIPLIGGTVEKHVLEQLQSSYDRAADLTRTFLAGRVG
jgi:hypothetical protein